jgi:signal peptidase II
VKAYLERLKVTRLGWLAYGLALAVIVVDQLSKMVMLGAFSGHCPGFEPYPGSRCSIELSPMFDLTMVWNPGMSFGFLRAHGEAGRWMLSVFAVGVAILIGWWARKADKRLFAWPAGLLMGGAIGNVIDRLRYGAVVDFLDFSGLGFGWVFNVADSAITVGATLLLVEAFLPSLRSMLESRRENGN